MWFINLIANLLPTSYSIIDQVSAMVIIFTALVISVGMLLLVLYWVWTKSFETIKTIFGMFAIMLGLGICISLALNDQVRFAAWILILLMIGLNIISMLGYGISTSGSSAYVVPILLAVFCLTPQIGIIIAGLGCVLVFGVAFLQSKNKLNAQISYQVSHLTFDAPVLSLVYIFVALISGSWVQSIKSFLFN